MFNQNFKIHSICLVKNEADILRYALEKASQWSDYIYIYDNGSTDATWEIAQSMKNKKIIPWKQDDKPFRESLRAEVFNEFRGYAQPGDWWCRLDADEFYLISPKLFLAQISPIRNVVWGIAVEYYLSQEDIKSIDFTQPINIVLPQIHLYQARNSETRFFRHRERLTWDVNHAWPKHIGLANPERIFYRHYKYRSPAQIQSRLKTRKEARKRGYPGFDYYVDESSWQDALVSPDSLWDEATDPLIHVSWEELPNHVGNKAQQLIKLVMHQTQLWP